MLTLAVALAAGLGAVCRYLLDEVVSHRTAGVFPYGTFSVNVTGSFVLGLVVGLTGGGAAAILGAGFAGGYTTLSTWAWESVELAREGALRPAVGNVVVSLAAGLAAGAAGLGLALL
ncbi:MAG: fluoride exporter [Frankiaceae bacterium]|jgi:CrcB protein|nr:fluoride exporter [Frankiaceae bacterium]